MSWTIVAKKDFQDAARSRMLWSLTALFVLFMAGMTYLYTITAGQGTGDPALDSLGLISFMSSAVALLVPIIGLVIGHKSIAGEVESGSAKLLLSLPHSRRDAVLGKIAGRSAVLTIATVIGLLVGAVMVLLLYDEFNPLSFAIFGLLSVYLGVTYTAIGVGISSLTNDSGRATIGAAGFFIIVEVILPIIPGILVALLDLDIAEGAIWPMFVPRLAPSSAYSFALADFIPEASLGTAVGMMPDSVFLSGAAMLVILLGWLVLAPLVGYLRFEGRDL